MQKLKISSIHLNGIVPVYVHGFLSPIQMNGMKEENVCMCGHLSVLHREVWGSILKIGAGPRGGTHTYQTFMAYPFNMQ